MQNVLQQITEGMKVFDIANHEIGTVDYVKMVDGDPVTGEPIAAGENDLDTERHSILGDIADAFRTDEVPDVVQERLLHDGFVRMDAEGLFHSDRYILPDQIGSVVGDRVNLNVAREDLVKRH